MRCQPLGQYSGRENDAFTLYRSVQADSLCAPYMYQKLGPAVKCLCEIGRGICLRACLPVQVYMHMAPARVRTRRTEEVLGGGHCCSLQQGERLGRSCSTATLSRLDRTWRKGGTCSLILRNPKEECIPCVSSPRAATTNPCYAPHASKQGAGCG